MPQSSQKSYALEAAEAARRGCIYIACQLSLTSILMISMILELLIEICKRLKTIASIKCDSWDSADRLQCNLDSFIYEVALKSKPSKECQTFCYCKKKTK
jgi:hypothetical protein